MLEASGGGGYGGTDWMSKNVVEMWQAVESQDTTTHYKALTGWQQSADLLLDHQGQVTNYRNSVAAAWPPEKSPASAAYLARLDELITSLQETYDAAVANHRAFADATLSISLSRQKVKQIYDEYTANQAEIDDFNSQPPHGGLQKTAPPKPPVADGRQEQLNNEARSVMIGLSSDIIRANGQLIVPPEYVPTPGRGVESHKDNGGTYVPPPLPPTKTYHPTTPSGASSSAQHASSTNTSGSNVTSPATSSGGSPQPGLVLGGVHLTPITAPISTPGFTPSPTAGGNTLPSAFPAVPIFPTSPPNIAPGSLPPASGAARSFAGEGFGRPGVGAIPEGGVRAMPPGGVIGGTPGMGLGQPASGARSAGRVNPVGGVIGSNGTQPMGGGGGRNSRRSGEPADEMHWDPDNPWKTAEGVASIVVPPTEQPVTPGPAIGLPS